MAVLRMRTTHVHQLAFQNCEICPYKGMEISIIVTADISASLDVTENNSWVYDDLRSK
jgi:hypothetical protein